MYLSYAKLLALFVVSDVHLIDLTTCFSSILNVSALCPAGHIYKVLHLNALQMCCCCLVT